MRIRLFAIVVMILWFSFPGETRAQSEIGFVGVEIDLWPEFDRPEMLVIYRMLLSEETRLPVEWTLHIPVAAGEPNALAVGPAGDMALNVGFAREIDAQGAAIRFVAKDRFVQLEYYDPSLSVGNLRRQYNFSAIRDYPVAATLVQIKLPADVRDVAISPSFGDGLVDDDSYIYYRYQVDGREAGETFQLSLEYERGADPQKWFAWGFGAVGILLVGLGVYRYAHINQRSKRAHRATRQKAAGGRRAAGDYCHNCGAAARVGDKFCWNCGTILR